MTLTRILRLAFLLAAGCGQILGSNATPVASDAPGSTAADLDGDGRGDAEDNCPTLANASQANYDGDAEGDACDADADGDGQPDTPPATGHLARVDVLDYLTTDVCVDANDHGVAVAPTRCLEEGLRVRNLRLDEAVLGFGADQGDAANPFGFQLTTSVPVRLTDGRVGRAHWFDFGWGGNRRAFFEFDREGAFAANAPDAGAPIDGYDVVEFDGMASIIGTCDSTGRVQPMWSWPGGNPAACALDDAWLLFPTHEFALTGGTALASLRIAPTCPQDALDPAHTTWEQREVSYASGLNLPSLISTHYGGASAGAADHFERFYYVRPFGRARWERWQRSGVAKPTGCNGPTEVGGFVRVDCRDWTTWVKAPYDGADPHAWPIDTRLAWGNLLVNHDFGAGPGQLAPWTRLDETTTTMRVIEEATNAVTARNRYLSFRWNGQGGGQSLFQDIPRGTLRTGTTLQFGGRLWSQAQAVGVTFVVHQLAENGTILNGVEPTAHIDAALTPSRTRFAGQLELGADTARLRFEIYVPANADIFLDDAWLAITAQP